MSPIKRPHQRAIRLLLWTVLLGLSLAATIAGINLVGTGNNWQRGLGDTAAGFFIWRVCLYGATACGWRWMRRRLLACEAGDDVRRRLIRTEVAGVIAIVALETSLLIPLS